MNARKEGAKARPAMKKDEIDRLLLSAWLDPDERAEQMRGLPAVDESVKEAVDRLARMVRIGRMPQSASDDALVRLVAHRAGLDPGERPDFDRVVDDLLLGLPAASGTRERWDSLCARMTSLDAGSDAAAQFARLTGRSVGPPDRTGEPSGRLRLWRPRAWAAAAVIVTLGLTAALGQVAEDDAARAAHGSVVARSASRTRGPIPAGRVSDWMSSVRSARDLRLGLWPTYDVEALARVEEEIVTSGDSSSAVLLLLGEARLMRGSTDAGLETLREAAEAGSEEARLLLEKLRR